MRLSRVILLLLAAATGAALPVAAQDILIFRPIDNSATQVTDASIDLRIQVSAFDKIEEVTINGVAQTITPGLDVQVVSNQALKPGSNTFVVAVKTASGTASRTFRVDRVEELTGIPEPVERKYPVSLVAAFGAQNNSNAFLSSSDEKSGVKLFALVVPSFERALADEDKARFTGSVYRETYSSDELEPAEVQFTRATGEFIRPLHDQGWFSVGGGVGIVDSGFDNPVTGQDQSERDLIGFARLGETLSETDRNLYEAELLYRDREDPSDSDFNEDALVITGHAVWERQISRYQSTFKGWATWDESDGKYADKYILRALADAKTPAPSLLDLPTGSAFNKVVLGAGAGARLRKYAQSNPLAGKAEQDIQFSALVNATYPLRRDWLMTGEISREQQTSNVSAAEYANNAITLTFIYIY